MLCFHLTTRYSLVPTQPNYYCKWSDGLSFSNSPGKLLLSPFIYPKYKSSQYKFLISGVSVVEEHGKSLSEMLAFHMGDRQCLGCSTSDSTPWKVHQWRTTQDLQTAASTRKPYSDRLLTLTWPNHDLCGHLTCEHRRSLSHILAHLFSLCVYLCHFVITHYSFVFQFYGPVTLTRFICKNKLLNINQTFYTKEMILFSKTLKQHVYFDI